MTLSRPARLMSGITLLTVPTIVYGGLTVLAVVTRGAHGLPPANGLTLTPLQESLFRAGHAHAGVLVILSLVTQVLLDSARLGEATRWVARIAGPAAAVLLSGGFFGIAFVPQLSVLLWAGAASLVLTMVLTGVGLVRRPAAEARPARSAVAGVAAAVLLVAGTAQASDGTDGGGAGTTGRIDVAITTLSGNPGRIICALFSSKAGVPMDAVKHAAVRVPARAKGSAASCSFEGVTPGEYAVAVLHDFNGNDRTDTNLFGVPTEGWGVSNNAAAALAPPSFEACRFTVGAGATATQAITMRY